MATQVTLGSGVVDSASGLKLRTNGSTEAVDISTGQVATLAQNPILTSGTANGVAYLNGSKVVTSGSALVFDGTNLSVGSGSGSPVLKLNGANTSGAGPYLQFLRGGTQTNIIGPYSIVASGTSNDLTYYSTTGYGHVWFSNGQASTINMQLDSSGNLGLGVTPSAWGTLKAIDVSSYGGFFAYSNQTGLTGNAYYDGSSWAKKSNAAATQYQQIGGQHIWYNAATGTGTFSFTQAMTLDASGNLLVGTTSSQVGAVSSTLQLISGSASNNAYFGNSHASTPYGPYIHFTAAAPNNTTQYFVKCIDSSAERATIRSNGGLANYSANNVNLSDERTKTDIQDAGNYLAKICAIPVRTFKYKDQTDALLNLGVIAQEVETVAPELVDVSGFGETPEDGVPLKAIYQTDLQYALMKCIQEQQALIATQSELITQLQADVAALKA